MPSHTCPTPVERHGVSFVLPDANATVVVNIFTLEVAVEDISTEGEAKGLQTALKTLLDEAGWTRPCCCGSAVQKGKFRPVSGFLNGIREGYKAVTEPGYAGQLSAYGTLAADTASEELEAFKRFTKEKGKQGEGSDSGGSGPCGLAPGRKQRARSQKGVVLHGPCVAR